VVILAAAAAAHGCARPAAPAPPPVAAPVRAVSCDALPIPSDSVEDTLYVGVEAPVHARPLPPGYADQVLDAIRQALVVPRPIALPVFMGGTRAPLGEMSGRTERTALRPAVAAEVEFVLGDTGSIIGRVSTSSLSPAVDLALADAPRRADSLHLLPPQWGFSSAGGPVRFYASLLSTRPTGPLWAPVLVVRVPRWRDGQKARPVGAAVPPPPAGAAFHNEDVVVEIVIDEHGLPVLSTFRVVEAHYRQFAHAAVNRLLTTSYAPAAIDGCAVKSIAELRYSFPVAD